MAVLITVVQHLFVVLGQEHQRSAHCVLDFVCALARKRTVLRLAAHALFAGECPAHYGWFFRMTVKYARAAESG